MYNSWGYCRYQEKFSSGSELFCPRCKRYGWVHVKDAGLDWLVESMWECGTCKNIFSSKEAHDAAEQYELEKERRAKGCCGECGKEKESEK